MPRYKYDQVFLSSDNISLKSFVKPVKLELKLK